MLVELEQEDYDRMLVIARSLIRKESRCTLTATGLVHELFLKLVRRSPCGTPTRRLGGFPEISAFAARVMRQILIDRARHRIVRQRSEQRSRGDAQNEAFNLRKDLVALRLIEIDDALALLQSELPDCAELARLRLYDGLTIEDAANRMGMSRATAFRKWSFCRTWLAKKLKDEALQG